jgi:Uma2 family endonuclease
MLLLDGLRLPRYAQTMSRSAERVTLSPAEFLAWERGQLGRHEYFHGEVFAMAGGSLRHNALCSNVSAALHAAPSGSGCTVLSSDQRVGFVSRDRYVYPDLSVVCGAVLLEEGSSDVLVNPTIVVEVLSGSTEQYDRGLKWEGYQRIASLTDYLLVSQTEARVEHFLRGVAGAWVYRAAGPGQHLELTRGVRLDVDVIFSRVFELPADA